MNALSRLYRRLLRRLVASAAQAAREESELHEGLADANRHAAACLRARSERLARRADLIGLEL